MSLSWEDREWLALEFQVVHNRLNTLFLSLRQIEGMELQVMTDLSDVQAAVNETNTVEQSAISLINGLADKITALSTDPAALADLAAQMRANSAALAADIQANTPAAPADANATPDPVAPDATPA